MTTIKMANRERTEEEEGRQRIRKEEVKTQIET
jgi:hypothetical protein